MTLSDKTYETIGRIWVILFVVSILVAIIGALSSYALAKRNAQQAQPMPV